MIGTKLLTRSGADEFDAENGVDTAGQIPLWKLRILSSNARFGVKYQTTNNPSEMGEVVEHLGIVPSDHTFIDFGCGKGRMLILAAKLGFKALIGVEFSSELCAIARLNMARLKIDASVIHGDAAEFEAPHGPLVAFFYNPFGTEVMKEVLAKLSKHRGGVFIIYKHPECEALLNAETFLVPAGSPKPDISVWRSARTETFITHPMEAPLGEASSGWI